VFTLPSTVLSGILLLAVPSNPDTRRPLPVCETSTRHIELEADAPGDTPEVCIRPGLSLSFFFDVKLARVEVEGRERFRRVDEGAASLSLVASEALPDGERIQVTVYFQSEAAPTRATFLLVAHPSQAERQVEVSRHERTVASYREGEQQAREEARQCREEKARLQAESGGQGGLTALILQGWLGKRVTTRLLTGVIQRPGSSIKEQSTITYRAVGLEEQGRVAVEVEFINRGTAPWTPAGAALMGTEREHRMGVKVWPLDPIPPGEPGRIVVELDAAEAEARGTFTLKLWDEQGREGAILDGVTFP
jgi:uncharacterized protein (TIGR02268 family)